MANQSLIYSNARVKVMENTFLTSEKITRMVFAEQLEDGIKILSESGYGGVMPEGNDFDAVLTAEDRRVDAFLAEAAPAGSGMDGFLIKNDYHNAKALTKAKYTRRDADEESLAPRGLIEIDAMRAAIQSDTYHDLPKPMAEALESIDAAFARGDRAPRTIDATLDRAAYADILAYVGKCKSKLLTRYWQINIDLSNISAFLRSRAVGKNKAFFQSGWIGGGTLGEEKFLSAYDQSTDAFCESLKYTDYRGEIAEAAAKGDMTAFECAWDNRLLELFRDNRNDLFTLAPLAGFYVGKKIEIKTVRMILVLLKSKADKSEIKRRLRKLYE